MAAASPKRKRLSRSATIFVALGVALLGVSAARLAIGEPIPRLGDGAIDWDKLGAYLSFRTDRLLIGLFVGSALAVSGALLQALLRNPLASPYILGISSGAALGVVVGAWLAGANVMGIVILTQGLAQHLAAVVGAIGVMAVVYALAQRRGWVDPLGLLLIGVIVNAINGAAIMFFTYLISPLEKAKMAEYMMGVLNVNAPLPLILSVGGVLVGGMAIAASLGRAMDVATLSDDEASALGLHLRGLRLGLFALAGLLTAGTVVLAGPIGFVGLIAPHIVRLLLGPAHRPLIAGSALVGAMLLVGADTAVKAIDAYVHPIGLLPVGILTALLGGPVFLWMLRRSLREGRVS